MKTLRFLRASSTIFVAATVFGVVSLGPESPQSQGVPVALAPLVLQALPSIMTVVGNLFKPRTKDKKSDLQNSQIDLMTKSSNAAGKQLEIYVKRTQILSTIVGATGEASANLAKMIQQIGGKTQLDKSDLNELSKTLWPIVTDGLKRITESKPDPKAFEGDTTATLAMKDITDEGLKNAITAQLTYNPSEPDPKLVANLQSNLVRLQSRFVQVGQVAAAELQFVSDGLADISATATAQTAKPNKTITAEEISEKSDSIKKSAFTGDAEPLNHENQQFMKKLKTAAAASSPIA